MGTFADIGIALSTLKTAHDLTKALLELKLSSAATQKVKELNAELISLQSLLVEVNSANLRMQTEYQELLREKDRIEQQLIDTQDWEAKTQKYSLREITPGTFVYAINENERGSEPVHWLCAKCYQDKKTSILQSGEVGFKRPTYYCPRCNVHLLKKFS